MAETFSLGDAVDRGARASIVDMKGLLDTRNWEASAASHMGHLWLTDCDSLYEHLASPKTNTIQNKRLAIDLNLLRQMIWERDGDHIGEIDHSQGDYDPH